MGFRLAAWILALAMVLAAATGCEHSAGDWCGHVPGACAPAAQAQEPLCPLDTHVCVPYVGGGWDNVLRWEGDKTEAPDRCPQGASHVSFWGQAMATPKPGSVALSLYVVGCGFTEPGTCEGVSDHGANEVCAPAVADWPACIVANSPRECPSPYSAQTVVGSDAPGDEPWTVCCKSPRDDARSHGL
jgi:hypothetical protein